MSQSELIDSEVRRYQSSGALERELASRRYDDDRRVLDLKAFKKRRALDDLLGNSPLDEDMYLGSPRIDDLGSILGRRGKQDLRSNLINKYRQRVAEQAQQQSETLAAELAFLDKEPSRAKRVLNGLLLREPNDPKSETRVPKEKLRLAAAAIKDLAVREGKPSDPTTIAEQLQGTFCGSHHLATLFDDRVSFTLAGNQILITPKMQYRYAVSSIEVTSSELICHLDTTDPKITGKAKQLSDLASIANANLEEIARAYPPLKRVIEYAGITAFLRWAICPGTSNQSCRGRDALTVDFSALGRYSLRDRERTPTPDMDDPR